MVLVRLVFFLWSDLCFVQRGSLILFRCFSSTAAFLLKGASSLDGFLYRRTGRTFIPFMSFPLQLVIGDESHRLEVVILHKQ